jgi:uncharacterized protein (DUF1778 family)
MFIYGTHVDYSKYDVIEGYSVLEIRGEHDVFGAVKRLTKIKYVSETDPSDIIELNEQDMARLRLAEYNDESISECIKECIESKIRLKSFHDGIDDLRRRGILDSKKIKIDGIEKLNKTTNNKNTNSELIEKINNLEKIVKQQQEKIEELEMQMEEEKMKQRISELELKTEITMLKSKITMEKYKKTMDAFEESKKKIQAATNQSQKIETNKTIEKGLEIAKDILEDEKRFSLSEIKQRDEINQIRKEFISNHLNRKPKTLGQIRRERKLIETEDTLGDTDEIEF